MTRAGRKGYKVGDLVQVTFLNYLKDKRGLGSKVKRGVVVAITVKREQRGVEEHTVYKILFTDGQIDEYPESIVNDFSELIRGVGETSDL